ncbi:protein kinase domain-containing protein [Actinacidiphila paucisporea]|uniref:Serine/threonine protein kinase n=1 Tax=Actinacidiphila paucisporea TaxID=310782 RepID=A0A1M7PML5_9ACTN|nr:protein kinase [Actinacidiphila paucisporea]SHN18477.1 Serine/threonine protein kinase [Actinacidiphila paucisporea]
MQAGWDTDIDLGGSGALPLGERDPRRIGRFPVVGVLGSGGMGRVYLGVSAPGRYAAVKQVLPALAEDDGFLRHFGGELDNLARLPAGVGATLLDSDRDARPPWFATAYIPGLTLADALRAHGGPLPIGALWALLRDAAAGLAELHARDMVHRGLKPSNVLLTEDGVTLVDFGVAREADGSRPARAGAAVGAPAYTAPEQASGKEPLTGAADVFALAAVLSYAAIGAPPFGEGAGSDVLDRVLHGEPELGPVRAVDAGLADVLAGCLDKDPEARPTAAEVVGEARRRGGKGAGAAELWPASVRDRIALRAAFASTAPDPDALTAPADRPAPPPPPQDASAAGPDADRRRRRRRKALLLALPAVLVAGAVLALVLVPDSGSAQDSASPGSSAPAASGPATPGPRTSAGTVAPAPSSYGPSVADPARRGGSGLTGGGTPGAPGPLAGTATATAPDGIGVTGGAPGFPTPTATSQTPTGTGQVRSYADAKCLADMSFLTGHAPQVAACDSKSPYGPVTYGWTFSAEPGGAFLLVSQSGGCLAVNSLTSTAALGKCDGSSGQQWRIGTATAHGSTYQNVSSGRCLAASSVGKAVTDPCDSAQAGQVWYRH